MEDGPDARLEDLWSGAAVFIDNGLDANATGFLVRGTEYQLA